MSGMTAESLLRLLIRTACWFLTAAWKELGEDKVIVNRKKKN